MLTNEHAHRTAILDALKSFTEDGRMRKGDAILVFYAGHGAEIDAPMGWECGGRKIQSIVPSDYCETPGLEVPSIPDRTLGALFDDIAEMWGNNIVSLVRQRFVSTSRSTFRLSSSIVALHHPVLVNLEVVLDPFSSRARFTPTTLTDKYGRRLARCLDLLPSSVCEVCDLTSL